MVGQPPPSSKKWSRLLQEMQSCVKLCVPLRVCSTLLQRSLWVLPFNHLIRIWFQNRSLKLLEVTKIM
uniref:Uncharacterized protein n=1 Tax=Anguilla anguilla TaxID=7936 RepID=A0A0E9VYE6_ANGAN